MDEITAFEQQVAREVVREAGPEPRFDALAVSRSATTRGSRWRFQSILSTTKFVVAGVIVALFGGFLLAGILTQPSEDELAPAVGSSRSPETTFESLIELPAAIPDNFESGSLDTPLGPARWARLVGNEHTVPTFIDPHPAPGGFISADERGLWRSSDLVTWVPEGLPVPRGGDASLLVADGVLAHGERPGPAIDRLGRAASHRATTVKPMKATRIAAYAPVDRLVRLSREDVAARSRRPQVSVNASTVRSWLLCPLRRREVDWRRLPHSSSDKVSVRSIRS